MKKNKNCFSLTNILLLILVLPVFCLADDGVFQNPLKGGINSLPGLLGLFLDVIVQIGVVVVIMAIIYTGFTYVMARGNEAKLTKAHNALLYTVIGSAIVLGAYVIAKAIESTVDQLKENVTQAETLPNYINHVNKT